MLTVAGRFCFQSFASGALSAILETTTALKKQNRPFL
jgi:hypothetical protein